MTKPPIPGKIYSSQRTQHVMTYEWSVFKAGLFSRILSPLPIAKETAPVM